MKVNPLSKGLVIDADILHYIESLTNVSSHHITIAGVDYLEFKGPDKTWLDAKIDLLGQPHGVQLNPHGLHIDGLGWM